MEHNFFFFLWSLSVAQNQILRKSEESEICTKGAEDQNDEMDAKDVDAAPFPRPGWIRSQSTFKRNPPRTVGESFASMDSYAEVSTKHVKQFD
jgi:hypothetical protein